MGEAVPSGIDALAYNDVGGAGAGDIEGGGDAADLDPDLGLGGGGADGGGPGGVVGGGGGGGEPDGVGAVVGD